MMIFNQFAEMGNPLWHYNVTGYALADLFEAVKKPGQNLSLIHIYCEKCHKKPGEICLNWE